VDAAGRHLLRVLRRLLVQPDVACKADSSSGHLSLRRSHDVPSSLGAPLRGQSVGPEAGIHTGLWRSFKAHGWGGKRSARLLTALYLLANGSDAIVVQSLLPLPRQAAGPCSCAFHLEPETKSRGHSLQHVAPRAHWGHHCATRWEAMTSNAWQVPESDESLARAAARLRAHDAVPGAVGVLLHDGLLRAQHAAPPKSSIQAGLEWQLTTMR
jgi:hypothetical protein